MLYLCMPLAQEQIYDERIWSDKFLNVVVDNLHKVEFEHSVTLAFSFNKANCTDKTFWKMIEAKFTSELSQLERLDQKKSSQRVAAMCFAIQDCHDPELLTKHFWSKLEESLLNTMVAE